MISKDQILKILKKYGFYSLNKAPYIYEDGNNLGVYFVWPLKHFGNLERILYFKNSEDCEKEIFKYWWFKENKDKYNILVELDNYEIINPSIIYKYNNIILTEDLMKNFDRYVLNAPKIQKSISALKRTAHILLQILEKKFLNQIDNFEKVNSLIKELAELKKELALILDYEYTSNNFSTETLSSEECFTIIKTLEDKLNELNDEDLISSFIDTLMQYMKNIDLSKENLQNGYLIIKYQYEKEDLDNKLNIVKPLKAKKKKLKNNKDLIESLANIDSQSKLKTIIDLDSYISNEQKRIEENYEDFFKIDKQALGDYLANFEKLNISIPFVLENDKEKGLNINVKKTIINEYMKLSDEHKCACIIANSFLGELISDLKEIPGIEDLNSSEIEQILVSKNLMEKFKINYSLVDNFTNINIRVKYMKLLKTSTFSAFINSLKLILKYLNEIDLRIDSEFDGYCLDNNDIKDIQLKNLWNKTKNQINIVRVNKNVKLYYSPVLIKRKVDIENNDITVIDQDCIFLFPSEVVIDKKNDILKVANYEKEKVIKENNYIKIISAKLASICSYNCVIIKDKE